MVLHEVKIKGQRYDIHDSLAVGNEIFCKDGEESFVVPDEETLKSLKAGNDVAEKKPAPKKTKRAVS